jgi:cytochrome P450
LIAGELQVQKGWIVEAFNICNHLSSKYFDSPEEFRPERWENQNEQAYTFLPFWAGPKNCLGQHLAMMESRIIWIYILLNYQIELKCK